ncbi:MAG: protein kinase, partial [Acidobacteria bacterium]|nr:protein kinase [Acidobacteriota bacterium]
RGVVHRDLKPANIMIDGHGRVRITDFGLAVAVEDESQAVEIAGTPAYMAPEQLAGKGATVRSDIYSLGLVLYEIYTGKRAFTASTLAELRQQKETDTPRAPSEIREGADPVVERLIRRCMERDPNARPASVAQLALALPGGDPLAAAIAAGETPSPEMVAESGGKEGLRPAVAWGLLAVIIAGMIAVMAINDRIMLHRRIPFEKSPDVLVDDAREIIRKAGYTEKAVDSAYGFFLNSDLIRYIEKSDHTADQWKRLGSNAILFWYRQSPYPLDAPMLNNSEITGIGLVSFDDPPMQFSGEVMVLLNTEGRLVSLRAIPPQDVELSGPAAPAPDWDSLLSEAGIDPLQWEDSNPEYNPQSYADSRAAWESSNPDWAGTRIEAAAYRGKPVSFEFHDPAKRDSRNVPAPPRQRLVVIYVLIDVVLLVGFFFARRNLRLGRGDRRGAMRMAIFVGILFMLFANLAAHHNLNADEVTLVSSFAAGSIAIGITVWVLYIGLEPFVRRRWPQVLVSWTRLISGDWNDPLVARDLLIGAAAGVLILVINLTVVYLIPSWFGHSQPPSEASYIGILGPHFALRVFLLYLFGGILFAVMDVSILFFLRILMKRQIFAVILFVLFFSALLNTTPWSFTGFATNLVINSIFVFILMRFGLIALAVSLVVWMFCLGFPLTLDGSAWYKDYSYAALAVFAVVVIYAFRKALGSRPLLAPSRLDG